MDRSNRLIPDQWQQARRRWEGDPREGFDWLAAEIREAFGTAITRQAVSARAKRDAGRGEAWAKGGDGAEPLARVVAQPAQHAAELAQPADGVDVERVDAEPVDLPMDAPQRAVSKGGRPTKYRPEFAQAIIDFFNVEPFEHRIVDGKGGKPKVVLVPKKFPMLGRFAHSIGASTETLGNWATAKDENGQRKHPEFFEAYARAKQLQEALLAEGALAGAFDSRFAQFAMRNLAAWKDRVDEEADDLTVSREELEAAYVTGLAVAHQRQAEVLARRRALRLGLAPAGSGAVAFDDTPPTALAR